MKKKKIFRGKGSRTTLSFTAATTAEVTRPRELLSPDISEEQTEKDQRLDNYTDLSATPGSGMKEMKMPQFRMSL